MVLLERFPYAEHFYELRRMNEVQLQTYYYMKKIISVAMWSRFQVIYNDRKIM